MTSLSRCVLRRTLRVSRRGSLTTGWTTSKRRLGRLKVALVRVRTVPTLERGRVAGGGRMRRLRGSVRGGAGGSTRMGLPRGRGAGDDAGRRNSGRGERQ